MHGAFGYCDHTARESSDKQQHNPVNIGFYRGSHAKQICRNRRYFEVCNLIKSINIEN